MSPISAPQGSSGTYNSEIKLNDFSGGRIIVPTVAGASAVGLTQTYNTINCDLSGKSIRKMMGYSKLVSSGITGDVSSIDFDEGSNKIFVSWGTHIGTLSGGTLTSIASGFTNGAIMSFSNLNGNILCVNGVDTPQIYNISGATIGNITTPPSTWGTGNNPVFAVNWSGRLFAAGCAGAPDTLFYSALSDPNTWTAGINANSAGALVIGDDGSPIKAIAATNLGMLIFKDPGLYFLTGTNTFSASLTQHIFDQTTFDWQCISPSVDARGYRAIVNVEKIWYAWGRNAVWKLTPSLYVRGFDVTIISNRIESDVLASVGFNNQICAAWYPARNQVWFGVAAGTASIGIDTIHVYDYINLDDSGVGGWSIRNGYSHKCMANVRDSNGATQIYSGGYAATPYIYQQNNTLNYDGSPMQCTYWTAWIPMGNIANGRLPFITVEMGSQTAGQLAFTYAYDYNNGDYDTYPLNPPNPISTWNSSGTTTWSAGMAGSSGHWISAQPIILEAPIFGEGRRIQFRFQSSLLNSNFDILEILGPVIGVGYA